MNYEHRFAKHVSARIGYTRYSFRSWFLVEPDIVMTLRGFPVLLNYLAGRHNHYFEIGAGVFVLNMHADGREIFFGTEINAQKTMALGAAVIGYRYQPANGGFLFRIGLTPLFHSGESIIMGGLSLGVAF
jgi:hypothetical protein